MSLSSKPPTFRAGRIVIGLDAKGLSSLSTPPEQPAFSPENEKEYLERVKNKARTTAREIMTTAMHEAETLKQRAREEGYACGIKDAAQTLETERQHLGRQLADVVRKLDAEKETIWSSYRQDIVTLLKASMEKVLSTELAANKHVILENLLNEALSQIDSRECLTVTCAPQDKPFIDDLLTRATADYPDLSKWAVKESAAMKEGGLKIESCNGMVDNSIAARYTLVRDILDQIDLEDTE